MMPLRLAATAVAVFLLASCAINPAEREAAPLAEACPAKVPAGIRCWRGIDSKGAHFLIAMPAGEWNGVLVVHAHGGPPLELKRERADEDIVRWSIWPRAGYAYAASVYSQPGFAMRAAAEDTDRVRRIFLDHFGKPRRTILHGQSWGGGVGAVAAEMYAGPGMKSPYDAVLLTSGVLAGSQVYDFRMDARAVYQYLCHNHPRPDEPQYHLGLGLPPGNRMTRAELASRVDECFGIRKPAAQRTPEQARKLKTFVDVIRTRENNVLGHLNYATFDFAHLSRHITGGGSPFGNYGAVYRGSPDDVALNAGVPRYRSDPAAVRAYADQVETSGRIAVPVLTLHAINDPIAIVEMEDTFRRKMESAGNADHLVQVFSDHGEHSYLSDPTYPAVMASLLRWVDGGARPTPASVAEECKAQEARFGPGCRIVPDYQVQPLVSRVPARER